MRIIFSGIPCFGYYPCRLSVRGRVGVGSRVCATHLPSVTTLSVKKRRFVCIYWRMVIQRHPTWMSHVGQGRDRGYARGGIEKRTRVSRGKRATMTMKGRALSETEWCVKKTLVTNMILRYSSDIGNERIFMLTTYQSCVRLPPLSRRSVYH